MRREDILFFLTSGKIYIYMVNSNREVIEKIDTSSFFKCGEISDVPSARTTITEVLSDRRITENIIKPNLYVLYNDVSNSDIKALYELLFINFSFNKIEYVPLSGLISLEKHKDRIIYFDGECYTDFLKRKKFNSSKNADRNSILIGKVEDKFLHYSKKDYLWISFKSHFTNR